MRRPTRRLRPILRQTDRQMDGRTDGRTREAGGDDWLAHTVSGGVLEYPPQVHTVWFSSLTIDEHTPMNGEAISHVRIRSPSSLEEQPGCRAPCVPEQAMRLHAEKIALQPTSSAGEVLIAAGFVCYTVWEQRRGVSKPPPGNRRAREAEARAAAAVPRLPNRSERRR